MKEFVGIPLGMVVAAALWANGTPSAAAAAVVVPGDGAAGDSYFVRPYVNLGGAALDGIVLDGAFAGRESLQSGTSSLFAAVDLGEGVFKLFASMEGPDPSFGVAAGTFGDIIRYNGASDVPVSMLFRYDSSIDVVQEALAGADPASRAFYVDAFFALYEADADASWDNWTEFGDYAGAALYIGRQFVNFAEDAPPSFTTHFAGTLGSEELFLTDGASYKLFAAYNLGIVPGHDYAGSITLDALNTGAITIDAPGGSFTSLSGEFLGFAKTGGSPGTVDGVPEPASWAMLVLGFGCIGMTIRRRERTAPA